MIIKKTYHFYAAHRNKEAGEKCGRLHGHTYDVTVHVAFPKFNGDVAMLFSDIDAIAEPVIKSFDHYLLLDSDDPLVPLLRSHGEPFIEVPFVTSAENMARHIFDLLGERGLTIDRIELAETKSSTVIYDATNL
jgi:6-pyruvoyltetrahydropterin/6-carboxytetrahydropterin synthase